MFMYFTSGTYDFLKNIKEKHTNEKLVLLENENNALLIHESSGSTFFSAPRSYEIFESAGEFSEPGFAVLNNIPVTDEGRPLFEYRFKNRKGKIENEPGFIGLRVLRPQKDNTYIVLTFWEDEKSFNNWQKSNSFKQAHSKPDGQKEEQSKPPQIFAGASYITKYYRTNEDE
ncbi:antibiotic biosynthesis monooxygenase family protein [Cytobacillus gottheilii]|uniref:antibiotic biosynthesis monooxygenase family protein n=1 Tax=Cytobacillus gottheilii TaxID=859144 RepID=UPI0009BAA756|nr:antibiotic biosynthesis monooxygenase [Cytobacillus gottheilii]